MTGLLKHVLTLTLTEVLAGRSYRTGYIGKWHLDGHGRSSRDGELATGPRGR